MATYLHPGVYVEEIPSGARPIEGVATSTAAFLGPTVKGPTYRTDGSGNKQWQPELIFKWDDYVEQYGGIRDTVSPDELDYVGYSVFSFFQNGGAKAYIVRLVHEAAVPSKFVVLSDDAGGDLLWFTAANEGTWGNDLRITVRGQDEEDVYTVAVGEVNADGEVEERETFTGLALADDAPNSLRLRVNGGSRLVKADLDKDQIAQIKQKLDALVDGVTVGPTEDGNDGGSPGIEEYTGGLAALTKHRDVRAICVPGQYYADPGKAIVDAAIAHAEDMTNRMVIVDPPPDEELETARDVANLVLPTSTYSVLYYPWAIVANPHFDEERRPNRDRIVAVPPCGLAAGTWAKVDSRRGVWKAPAGVETALLGLAGLKFQVEESNQDQLNPLGVNCIRTLPNFGPVIWGARTLATKAKPEWRYVPVRRTAIYIEQSLYEGIQWAVFEPNDHPLWSSLRTNIESFMNGLFRAGAFQGAKASDAYFVRCGLGDTMTQGDIDRGQVIVIVGFAPLKPAEFVIIRIQQKVGQQ